MTIDKVFWHDGLLGEISAAPKDRGADGFTFIMHASLYPAHESRSRQQYKFTFAGNGLLSLCCDFYEVRDNKWAGNISNGYVKKQSNGKVFWLYLSDGHITFKFKSVKIETLS